MNDSSQRLDDILQATNDAAAIVSRGKHAFDGDSLLIRAAKNIVTEIGEAAKALDPEVTREIATVPWRSVAGMRDRTIHRYPEVDLDVLWDTIAHDLPSLAEAITDYLGR